jgi:hypothetical protein
VSSGRLELVEAAGHLNRVTGLGVRESPSDADLDEIESFFRAGGSRFAIARPNYVSPG